MAKFVLVVDTDEAPYVGEMLTPNVKVEDVHEINSDPDSDFDTVWYEVQKIGVKA